MRELENQHFATLKEVTGQGSNHRCGTLICQEISEELHTDEIRLSPPKPTDRSLKVNNQISYTAY